jgi:4-amino-4-deoxy-L-arabinose transferase-like glycosyltransferase
VPTAPCVHCVRVSGVATTASRSTPARPRLLDRALSRVRRVPLALWLLLAVAAVHGTAWAIVTAPFNGPDEVAHFAYAQHLAETGSPPDRNDGTGSQSTQENAALYRLNLLPIRLHPEGKPNFSALDRAKREIAGLPASYRKDGSGPNSTANYPPLYYAYEAIPYTISPFRSLLGRLFVMRLATVLLFVALVALTWLIASELLARRWAVTLATTMVALQPKLGFGAGIVNPDLMLAALASGALLVALRMVKRGPTLALALWLAGLSGAAVLTHPRGLFLPPFALIVLALALWRHRQPARRAIVWAASACGVLIVAGAITAAFTRAHAGGIAYGTGNPASGWSPNQFASYLWQFYLPKLSFMTPKVGPATYGYRQVYIESFFGNFASFSVNYKPSTYDALQLLAGVGLVALYTSIVARWRTVVANWPVVVVSVVFFLGLMGLLHVVSYNNLRGSTDPVLTGRYLLPAVALYGVAIAWVCGSLPRRLQGVAAGLLIGGSTLLALAGIGLSLEHFYG